MTMPFIEDIELKQLGKLEDKILKQNKYLNIETDLNTIYLALGFEVIHDILQQFLDADISESYEGSGRIFDYNYDFKSEGGELQIYFEDDSPNWDEFSDPENPFGSL